MERMYVLIGISAILIAGLLFLIFPKTSVIEFSGVVVREIPKNSIIVEKDLSVAERIKKLYEEGNLFVFEGSVTLPQRNENEAWQQAANKARQELASFLGTKITSDSSLNEKIFGVRSAFGYEQDVSVVVNNFVVSSKVIAKWKVPVKNGFFEYHVLVFYDPDLIESVSKKQQQSMQLYFVVYDVKKGRVVKIEKVDDIARYKEKFEFARKNGKVVIFEVRNKKIIAKSDIEALRIVKNANFEDGRYRLLYVKNGDYIYAFILKGE